MKRQIIFLGIALSGLPLLGMHQGQDYLQLNGASHFLATPEVPFLSAENECNQRSVVRAEVRDHSIDCVIASLFLVGSGLPGVSDDIKLAANVSASVLWLGDSSIRLFYAFKKWRAVPQEPIAPLREVIVS